MKVSYEILGVVADTTINNKAGFILNIDGVESPRGFSDKVLDAIATNAGFVDFFELCMVLRSALDKGVLKVELEERKKGDKYVGKDGKEQLITKDHTAIINIPVYEISDEIAEDLKAVTKVILVENRRSAKRKRVEVSDSDSVPF